MKDFLSSGFYKLAHWIFDRIRGQALLRGIVRLLSFENVQLLLGSSRIPRAIEKILGLSKLAQSSDAFVEGAAFEVGKLVRPVPARGGISRSAFGDWHKSREAVSVRNALGDGEPSE